MIAPLRETERRPVSASLRAARRLVAGALLDDAERRDERPPVSPWRAWLLVAWIAVVSGAYVGHLWGVW